MPSTWEEPPPYRDPGYGGGGGGAPAMGYPRLTAAVKRLLWINGGVFLAFWLLARVFGIGAFESIYHDVLALAPGVWREWFPFVPIWQIGTYGFLHDLLSPFHILFNMLMLYFFGTMLEEIIGARRFVVTYLAAILVGGVVQLGANLAMGSDVPTLGASGAVLAIVVATAVLRPNTTVLFLFIPVTLKVMAIVMVALDLFMVLGGTSGNTATLVHLSGAAYGFIGARQRWIFGDPFEAWERKREQVHVEREQDDTARLDRLLQQIHDEGMNSLSKRDREFLRRVSSRK